jgi:hypothetical protein
MGFRILTYWSAVERFVTELTGTANGVAETPRTAVELNRATDRSGTTIDNVLAQNPELGLYGF